MDAVRELGLVLDGPARGHARIDPDRVRGRRGVRNAEAMASPARAGHCTC